MCVKLRYEINESKTFYGDNFYERNGKNVGAA